VVFLLAADAFEDIFNDESVTSSQVIDVFIDLPSNLTVTNRESSHNFKGKEMIAPRLESRVQMGKTGSEVSLQVADLQNKIEDPAQEPDLPAVLFNHCVKVFVNLFRIIHGKDDLIQPSICEDLREEFRKFYVWNDTFPTESGQLGSILATSRNLKAAVLGLMAQWARALCKGIFGLKSILTG